MEFSWKKVRTLSHKGRRKVGKMALENSIGGKIYTERTSVMKMKHVCLICLILCIFARPLYAASCPEAGQYSVPVDKKRVRQIDLNSHSRAREYRTQLRRAVGQPPNFSGHYVLLTWGCGSPCHEIALVDVRSGRVSFAPFYGRVSEVFKANSRLLVLNLPATTMFDTEYYEWTGQEFRELTCTKP